MRGHLIVLSAALLAGCNQSQTADSMQARSPGRYSGIGTFEPGRLWQEMTGAPAPQDRKAATLADDEHIIVVLDSHTGEVRQCGNHSGICVAMNPWSGKAAPLAAPTKLTKHAADLDAEVERDGSDPTNKVARGEQRDNG